MFFTAILEGQILTPPYVEPDLRWQALVAPSNWQNPTPAGRYHLVVVGGGAAGLVCAVGAATLGAKVALVEKHYLGGDCLNTGCIPSKTLLRSAQAAADVRQAGRFGIVAQEPVVDFPAVMRRVREVRANLAPNDSAKRLQALGVDVYFGTASFRDARSLDVNGAVLNFRKAILATGTHPKVIPNPLPANVPVYTSQTIFTLTTLPKRLLVIGAGPVGCELSQAFVRLGSQVTLIARHGRVLPKVDMEASQSLADALTAEGIKICKEMPANFAADAVLMAIGRKPNVQLLNLSGAGIAYHDETGILVDHHLRTTNRKIFAAGDIIAGMPRFTHAADATARVALRNALFPFASRFDPTTVPSTIYTNPEVAMIGDTVNHVRSEKIYFQDVDRGATDGASGFLKLYFATQSNRISGAVIVGPHATELITWVSSLIGKTRVAAQIIPYPTYSESLKKLRDQANKKRLRSAIKIIIKNIIKIC